MQIGLDADANSAMAPEHVVHFYEKLTPVAEGLRLALVALTEVVNELMISLRVVDADPDHVLVDSQKLVLGRWGSDERDSASDGGRGHDEKNQKDQAHVDQGDHIDVVVFVFDSAFPGAFDLDRLQGLGRLVGSLRFGSRVTGQSGL